RPVHHLDSSRMTAALGRRGSFAHWHTDSIALARGEAPSNAAACTPPAVDAFGSWAIVADARIDNRKELRAALGIDDGAMPDSRLVLHAYARWGTECPAHLIGDFAFVIWDEQLKQLFCVRDRLGIKPLYYAHSAIGFAVASESKALLALPWV